MWRKTNRLRPVPQPPLGMNINIHVFLIFIIYNIYIICPLIFLFFPNSRSSSSGGLLRDFQLDYDPHTSQGANELLGYVSNICEPEGVDVMDWWRRNASAYPTLAMMARDVFAVPVSTVPSESCFSSANRILSDKRSKLGAHVFERLVCLKDWIDAENRAQHGDPLLTSSEVETEESGTEPRSVANSDSDGAEESEQWYMNVNY